MTTRVFSHENLAIVHDARNRLETAGIECEIKNEFHGGGGHVGLNIVPIELWVLRDDTANAAKRMLAEDASNDSVGDSQWICDKCGENNDGGFTVCWHCQASISS